MSARLGVIGLGRLGSALVRGISSVGAVSANDLYLSDREPSQREAFAEGQWMTNDEIATNCHYILVAVEPRQMEPLLKSLNFSKETCLISVAAGVRLEQLEEWSSLKTCVRVMPNSPASIGEAMSVFCSTPAVNKEQVEFVKHIFSAVGDVVSLEEKHFDLATALCGSGPAFHYFWMQAQIDAAVKAGLDEDLASRLVIQTCLGAAKLAQSSGSRPRDLQDQVTTKGGCTEVGILHLQQANVEALVAQLIDKTSKKARSLSE